MKENEKLDLPELVVNEIKTHIAQIRHDTIEWANNNPGEDGMTGGFLLSLDTKVYKYCAEWKW